VTPTDALLIINLLNSGHGGPLGPLIPGEGEGASQPPASDAVFHALGSSRPGPQLQYAELIAVLNAEDFGVTRPGRGLR